MSIAPPDYDATEPRYTTVDDVKEVLGIDPGNADKDDRITEAIVAVEVAMDIAMGRSMPDNPDGAVTTSGVWSVTRPSAFVLPPTAGELNIDDTGFLWEMSKTDDDGVDKSGNPPVVGELIRADWPIVVGNTYFTIEAVVEQTTYWEMTVSILGGVIIPPTMTGLRVTFSQMVPDELPGPKPPVLIVPSGWSATAKAGAVGVYKASEAPFGTAGQDDWLGAISVPTIVSEAIRRNPLMMGWQVSFGVR